MANNKVVLTIVVSGTPTDVEANVNAPLLTVIPLALKESGNTGRSPEEWELRDTAGNLLDLTKKIEEFGFASHARLFLNVKEGIGG